MNGTILPGFPDPGAAAQACFRAALDAMSRPGRSVALPVAPSAPPPFHPATAALLLSLADGDTPVWLPGASAPAAGEWLRFHTGAPLVSRPEDASFAVLTGAAGEPSLSAFAAGDDLFPDRSATLLIQCSALDGGQPVDLSGPGIAGRACVAPADLPGDFWRQMAASNSRYPCGVDVILVAGDRIMGLPRSLAITPSKQTEPA